MAPYDPYSEPLDLPTPHERLIFYLEGSDPQAEVQLPKSIKRVILDLPNEVLEHILDFVSLVNDCTYDRMFLYQVV